MKWIKNILRVLFPLGLIFLLSFTNKQHRQMLCADYRIELVNEENSLITINEIVLIMDSIQESIVGRLAIDIPIFEIEQKIQSLSNVENAEVYIDMQGILFVEINQKKAILRINPKGARDFYMDSEGSRFDLSRNYTEHVIVANGNIEDSTDFLKAFTLANFISSDSLWKQQIIQIYFKENKEIELIPRVGNHSILFGDISNYQYKFRKLRLFYEKGVNQVGWNNYEKINLKFKNQIVCEKK